MTDSSDKQAFTESEYGAISTIDGRDARLVDELRPYISEFGFMKNRCRVEAAWIITLADILPDVPALPKKSRALLEDIKSGHAFTNEDMAAIKTIEAITRHDVKAVELMLRDRFTEMGAFEDHIELTHFGLTSEDVNNLAEALGLRDIRNDVFLPSIISISNDLADKAKSWAGIPMLGRTHGQPATPTTLGKEFAVFVDRITKATDHFAQVRIYGKLNGATGGYNALKVVYPEVNWPAVSREFVTSLGLEFNRITTQVEPHDWMARYLHALSEASNPMVDLSKDAWLYISQDYLRQTSIKGEVGSSTMPHKVNPIDFEKAEANFDTFATLADGLARKLTQSRLQRDLSDSSSRRAIGTALGHNLIALKSLQRGLSKISPSEAAIANDLDSHWEVLTEPIQQMLRRYNIKGGYDTTKSLSRGKLFTKQQYNELVDSVADVLPEEATKRLRSLTPATYVGYAKEIALNQE
ncbi:MAG TPA: adenylosuccinate lyase [Candidatus Saccharimonadales bacterium]|nr:adenylosuccinate lyase [Candidatus Saccharimonadales bacterium]